MRKTGPGSWSLHDFDGGNSTTKIHIFSLETLQWVKQVGRVGLAVVVLVLWDGKKIIWTTWRETCRFAFTSKKGAVVLQGLLVRGQMSGILSFDLVMLYYYYTNEWMGMIPSHNGRGVAVSVSR